MTSRICCRLLAAISVLPLGACANPYGQSVGSVSYDANPAAGEIVISSPKLYRREALINERRQEVNYLGTLIENSKDAVFGPEIVRELEVIRAISASVGLKFDPASGQSYRRTEEKAEIQQQLDVLALNMQLDKLKREAELMKTALAAQTAPTAGAGGAGNGGTVTITPVATASVTELLTALKTLTDRLAVKSGEGMTALKGVDIAANPIDIFQDRGVYRELLNNARNAASLDELHDRDGSALIRLNMTATVFPPDKRRRAGFGRLGLQLQAPVLDPRNAAFEGLYRDWLNYVSPQISQPVRNAKGAFVGYERNSLGQALFQRPGIVDIVVFEFSRGKDAGCRGLAVAGPSPPGCQQISVAAPPLRLPAGVPGGNAYGAISVRDLQGLYVAVAPFLKDEAALFHASQDMLLFNRDCSLTEASINHQGAGLGPGKLVLFAGGMDRLLSIAPLIEQRAVASIRALDGGTDQAKAGAIYFKPAGNFDLGALELARAITRRTNELAYTQCEAGRYPDLFGTPVPQAFLDQLVYGSVGVYQLGPRQLVQIVSTEARAAESIALAATIAAQAPGQGIGGDGAFGMSRSAIGRADALERVPLVVAFADAAQREGKELPRFGWMMGPRAQLDTAKQRIDFSQGLRPQELTADLVVPGWWPYLTLQVASTWAPEWTGNKSKDNFIEAGRQVRVQLAPSSSDFEQLTNQILGGGSLKVPQIRSIEPAVLPACATGVALQLRGPNIWRADKVIIGGKIIAGEKLSVLAGMEGLLVDIDKADFPVTAGTTVGVTALTPYGPADYSLGLSGAGKGCTADNAGKAPGDGAAKPKG